MSVIENKYGLLTVLNKKYIVQYKGFYTRRKQKDKRIIYALKGKKFMTNVSFLFWKKNIKGQTYNFCFGEKNFRTNV